VTDDRNGAAGPGADGSRTTDAAGPTGPPDPTIGVDHGREAVVGQYRVVGHHAALDLELAHRALSVDSYWARGRTRADNDLAFARSRVAVALDGDGATVGFARAVTDGVTHAWLADVWVEPDHRGHGLGRALTSHLVDAPDLTQVRRWALATSGAEDLYRSFGFAAHEDPPTLMERFGTTT